MVDGINGSTSIIPINKSGLEYGTEQIIFTALWMNEWMNDCKLNRCLKSMELNYAVECIQRRKLYSIYRAHSIFNAYTYQKKMGKK